MTTALVPATMYPDAGLPPQAESDGQLIALWLHGKLTHSQRAYATDVQRAG